MQVEEWLASKDQLADCVSRSQGNRDGWKLHWREEAPARPRCRTRVNCRVRLCITLSPSRSTLRFNMDHTLLKGF